MELIARLDGEEERLEVSRHGSGYRVVVGEHVYDVDLVHYGHSGRSLIVEGAQHEVTIKRTGNGRYLVSSSHGLEEVELADPLTHLAQEAHATGAASGPQTTTAYMPGRVVDLLVEQGETIEAGQGVLVLEAMKMENEIRAERSGVLRQLFVDKGQAVESGDPLFDLE